MGREHVFLLSHNIFVKGQMWGFRRWALKKYFTLEAYTKLQTELLFKGIEGYGRKKEEEGYEHNESL